MKFYIIIPTYNEEAFIAKTLDSLAKQTYLPEKIVVVNDGSTDNTISIVESFIKNYSYIQLVNSQHSSTHKPGSKIIEAFYKGLEDLDEDYDVICKFDADLIFPSNYLETLKNHLDADLKLGMVSGFCYIEKNSKWILENLTRKDHIRGALKAYRKSCFKEIGGLKKSMGWDTVDELLAQFYGWKIKTDESLIVKHLKPTGYSYNSKSKKLQGEAFYKLRYGFLLTLISALKLAFKKKKISLISDYLNGYFKAKKEARKFLVNEEQGKFIRNLRWKNIKKRVM